MKNPASKDDAQLLDWNLYRTIKKMDKAILEGLIERICPISLSIIDFMKPYQSSVDTLLIHCYAGQSRSRAVGAFAVKMLVGDNRRYFDESTPNQYIYDVLEAAWMRRQNFGV